MKKCPTCQKTFNDDKRFCQIDGTPLVDDAPAKTEAPDPYKTVVGQPFIQSPKESDDAMKTMIVSSKPADDDLLQIPEPFDPMKTMVVSDSAKKSTPPAPPKDSKENLPEPPKFSEPSLNPPSFGDLSSNTPPKYDPPSASNEPPKFDSPFSNPKNEPPKFDSPFSSPPVNETPKFSSSSSPKSDSSDNSPFGSPQKSPASSSFDSPPPPYKEPSFDNSPPPFQQSPFSQPQSPFGQSNANDAFSQPMQQNNDWAPPPAPVDSWNNQEIGSNTPFSPPVAGGQNNTLAIVSLVLGISSFICLGPLGAIGALITGYMQKNNIKNNPSVYGGGGLATGGMILGGISLVLGIVIIAIYALLIVANM